MHIMEGYLPAGSAIAWTALSAPFLFLGLRRLDAMLKEKPALKLLLGAVGGFAFVLSALKIPSVMGSCSHPTGTGLGAILFGPGIMAVISFIVLLFQALLLAHGGLTTLGANLFSMGIAGPWLAYGIYRCGKRMGLPLSIAVFLSATLGDLATYAVSSFQLAFAYPDPQGGSLGSSLKFLFIFALTQVPLAITEGLLTVLVVNTLIQYSSPELQEIGFLVPETGG